MKNILKSQLNSSSKVSCIHSRKSAWVLKLTCANLLSLPMVCSKLNNELTFENLFYLLMLYGKLNSELTFENLLPLPVVYSKLNSELTFENLFYLLDVVW